MKCPNCGFRNLPGAKICGACGADLTVQSGNVTEPFYPPRAWGRQFRRFHERAARSRSGWQAPSTQDRPDLSPTSTLLQQAEQRRTRRLILLTALKSLTGLIPGLGLILEKRARTGRNLMLAFLFCTAVVLLCWRNFLSNLALLAIAALLIYSVGATFFAAWQRNNLPTLANFQKAGIWLTVVSLFLWAYVLFRASLNIVGGIAFVPITAANDPVIQFGNQVLYSHLSRHLENLKPGDYVLVDTTGARELTPITQRLGYFYDPVQVVFSPLTIGRVEAVRQSEVGTELVISVPMIFGRQTMYQRVLVPMDAVQGKIVAILNPPSRRRWLP
jgi:hypothetical protein